MTQDKLGLKPDSELRQIGPKTRFGTATNSYQRQIRTENQIQTKHKSGVKTRFGLATKSGKDKFRSKTKSYRKPDKGHRQVRTKNESAQKTNSDQTKLRTEKQIRNEHKF